MTISEEQGKLTRTFGARSRAYDNDVIQLFWPFADFTQPIVTKNLDLTSVVRLNASNSTYGNLGT